jgi:hypothetical protein
MSLFSDVYFVFWAIGIIFHQKWKLPNDRLNGGYGPFCFRNSGGAGKQNLCEKLFSL